MEADIAAPNHCKKLLFQLYHLAESAAHAHLFLAFFQYKAEAGQKAS
jgi:hypothetical protein